VPPVRRDFVTLGNSPLPSKGENRCTALGRMLQKMLAPSKLDEWKGPFFCQGRVGPTRGTTWGVPEPIPA
jgi:hypothetical protein